jgi:hypothetical protein
VGEGLCHERDLGPWVGLGKARPGLQLHGVGTSSFTAHPLVRLAPAAVSSPHTLTPSPTFCFCLLPTCGSKFRAWPLQPSPSAATHVPSLAYTHVSLPTARGCVRTHCPKIRESAASVRFPQGIVPCLPQLLTHQTQGGNVGHLPVCPRHARLTGSSTLHTLVPVIDTVICYTPSACRFEAGPCRPVAASARPALQTAIHL